MHRFFYSNYFLFMTAGMAITLTSGCENKEAVHAMQSLTSELSAQVNEKNAILEKLGSELNDCRVKLAKARREPAMVGQGLATIEAPKPNEKQTLNDLEAYKKALTDTLDRQTAKIDELSALGKTCSTDLAAAGKGSKRPSSTVSKKAPATDTPKPTVVKQAEEKGEATSGFRSRYKKKK